MAKATGSLGSSRESDGQGHRPLGQLEELAEADADLLLERLGDVLELLAEVVPEVLHGRVVPELSVVAAPEGLAELLGVVQS